MINRFLERKAREILSSKGTLLAHLEQRFCYHNATAGIHTGGRGKGGRGPPPLYNSPPSNKHQL